MNWWVIGGLVVILLALGIIELVRLGAWRNPKPWDGDGE